MENTDSPKSPIVFTFETNDSVIKTSTPRVPKNALISPFVRSASIQQKEFEQLDEEVERYRYNYYADMKNQNV